MPNNFTSTRALTYPWRRLNAGNVSFPNFATGSICFYKLIVDNQQSIPIINTVILTVFFLCAWLRHKWQTSHSTRSRHTVLSDTYTWSSCILSQAVHRKSVAVQSSSFEGLQFQWSGWTVFSPPFHMLLTNQTMLSRYIWPTYMDLRIIHRITIMFLRWKKFLSTRGKTTKNNICYYLWKA